MSINNFEIFNYLNLVNTKLGKLYKVSGFNPFPDNFVFSKKVFKERILLNQMQSEITFPDFVFADKKSFKKLLKNSIKNIKILIKNKQYTQFMSENFANKFGIYLTMRENVTELILKDFNNVNFDECDAFEEIYSINPVLSELLELKLFEKDAKFEDLFKNLEKNYKNLYEEKLKLINKKENVKTEKKLKIAQENSLKNQKKIAKNAEKCTISKKDIKKEAKIEKTKNQEDIKKIKNKTSKEM